MERRRLGRTGHHSSVVAFGGAAFASISQDAADDALAYAFERGVNHLDVAPAYGQAELRMAPFLQDHRDEVFLGCKTTERRRDGALAELHRSLERLGVERLDLYQLHGVCWLQDLDDATAPGGALEAIVEAREQGLVDHIGITGHELSVASVHAEALRRFPFDTVMVPLNARLHADADYRAGYQELMELVTANDVGVHLIKSVARAPWRDRERTHTTWYEPFTDRVDIEAAMAFALAQPVTTLCTAGDVTVMRTMVDVAAAGTPTPTTAPIDPAADGYDLVFPSILPSRDPPGSAG